MTELEVLETGVEVRYALERFGANQPPDAVICKLGGGILRFTTVVYPGVDLGEVYARHTNREPGGSAAHFDLYEPFNVPEYPWLGVYNLSGISDVRTAVMPRELSEDYFTRFPSADDAAYGARRDYSNIVMRDPLVVKHHGTLGPDTGLVIYQGDKIPPVIHEVIPKDSGNPGEFIKLVHPKQGEDTVRTLRDLGFTTLEELVRDGLLGESSAQLPGQAYTQKSDESVDEIRLHPPSRSVYRRLNRRLD